MSVGTRVGRVAGALLCSAVLVACGGGGGDPPCALSVAAPSVTTSGASPDCAETSSDERKEHFEGCGLVVDASATQ
jgi:hypothetical protein